jgi:signal transduction histidine kinase
VEQMVYNYKPLMLENIHFENKVLKAIWLMPTRSRLKIILRNLLDNAIKFSKPRRRHKIIFPKCGSDFVILLLKSGLGMDESTRQTSERNSIAFEEENEDIVGRIRIAIMQIYDQEKRREIQD